VAFYTAGGEDGARPDGDAWTSYAAAVYAAAAARRGEAEGPAP